MAKKTAPYICSNDECRKPHYKWQPMCFDCQSTIVENNKIETEVKKHNKHDRYTSEEDRAELLENIKYGKDDYYKLPHKAYNYFFGQGKGIQNASVNLIYGDPGAGKSTFLGQLSAIFSKNKDKVLYNSGEESKQQVKGRAARLSEEGNPYYYIGSQSNIHALIEDIISIKPKFLVVDSIQTMHDPENNGTRGGVSQIKSVTGQLIQVCKRNKIITFIVAHVTKSGDLAGPQHLEHMVDAVFYLENPEDSPYRILRAIKNRFGLNESIFFAMKNKGLELVENPSMVFLEERPNNSIGSVIVPIIEGTNSMLVELQALVVENGFNGNGLRNARGVERGKLIMLLAVIQKYADISFLPTDVHVNIAGGLKTKDNGVDLGLVKALISSFEESPINPKSAYIGEVGLAGEVRSVSMIDSRVKECANLGLRDIYIPERNKKDIEELKKHNKQIEAVNIHYVSTIKDIM